MYKILRLEYPCGNGIFRIKDKKRNIYGHSNFNNIKERILGFNIAILHKQFLLFIHYCGWANEEQMLKWFTKQEIIEFLEKGASLYKLTVKEMILLDDQVFYKKEDVIKKINISKKFINMK